MQVKILPNGKAKEFPIVIWLKKAYEIEKNHEFNIEKNALIFILKTSLNLRNIDAKHAVELYYEINF